MLDSQQIHQLLHPGGTSYDPDKQLMRIPDGRHDLCYSARYASYVIALKQEAYYGRACAILDRMLSLQNTNEASPLCGLWACFLEEDLEKLPYPDFNVADFIAKTFLDILYRNPAVLSPSLKEAVILGLLRAIECSIRRNIAPDYTNISIISAMVIVSAGELLEDERLFAIGKQRLKKLYDYTCYCTGFSEYNSHDYSLLDIEETTRMLDFFRDPECRAMAQALNFYAWDMLTSHFNLSLGQLSPPQSRGYYDLERGRIQALLYLGTGGKYGKIESLQAVAPPWLIVNLCCPESCMAKLAQPDCWLDHRFYRTNNLISAEEETAIITNRHFPDLYARTFQTPAYSIGSFSFCDFWKQRRNCMAVWGKENPCWLRPRCLMDGKDFCSAVCIADQQKNLILGQVGFVTDRGWNHYLIDTSKTGPYAVSSLCFRFELGGSPDTVTVTREGNRFLYTREDFSLAITLWNWVFDGKPGEIFFDEATKAVELRCFADSPRFFLPSELGKTYGVFTIQVQPEAQHAPQITEAEGILTSVLSTLRITGFTQPVSYDQAANIAALAANN